MRGGEECALDDGSDGTHEHTIPGKRRTLQAKMKQEKEYYYFGISYAVGIPTAVASRY